MTYVTYTQLPPQVKKAFSFEDAEGWRALYNNYFEENSTGDVSIDEVVNDACYHAWLHSREASSSRSFTAQVAVEDVDTQGDVPVLEKYLDLAQKDVIQDGGVGVDKHTSRNTWCVWDVVMGEDDEGRNALIIQGNFFRDKPMFDIVWNTFLRGRSQFSLGTHTNREYRCNAGVCHIYATPNQWFEISIVDVGASPNTGVIDIHVPEGEGTFNPRNKIEGSTFSFKETEGEGFNDFCGIEYSYEGMKNEIRSIFPRDICDVEWVCVNELGEEDECIPGNRGFHIYSTLDNKDTIMDIVDKWCAEVFIYTQPIYIHDPESEDDNVRISIIGHPAVDATPLTVTDVIYLLIDEEEAITMYDEAIGKARKLVGDDIESDYIDELIHIRDEEKEHILELKELLGKLLYKQSIYMTNLPSPEECDAEHEDDDNISLKDAQGKFDGARICPAGQHSHIGIEGCHDITQTHALDIQMIREGLIDISNEDIDIDAIKGASTERLKAIVLTIAKVVSQYSRPEAMTFMSSSMGKEFALMLTELIDRREKEKVKRDDMSKETEGVISEKMNLDPAGDMQNLVSLLAGIQAEVKQLNQTIMELKSADMTGNEQGVNIADAVSSAVDSVGISEVVEGEDEGGGDAETVVEPIPEEGEDGEGKEEESESKDEIDEGGDIPKEDEETKKTESEDGGDDGGGESEGETEEDKETAEKEDEYKEDEETEKKVKETEAEPGTPGKTVDQPVTETEEGIAEKASTEVPTGTAPSSPNANVNSGGTADIIPSSVVGDEPVVETTDGKLGDLAPDGISLKEGFTDGTDTTTRTTPPGVSKGPIGKQLEDASEASIPKGMAESEKFGLSGWVDRGKDFLRGSNLVREVESTPLETKISLKSADSNMKVIEPEEVREGTGLKLTNKGKGRPEFKDVWNAIGTPNFDNVYNEVIK